MSELKYKDNPEYMLGDIRDIIIDALHNKNHDKLKRIKEIITLTLDKVNKCHIL